MHRTLARASVAGLLALTAAGAAAPAAIAAGHGGHQGHGGQGGHHGDPAGDSDKVARDIARKDRALARVLDRVDRAPAQLADDVAVNIDDDRDALAQATTRSEVRSYRPEVYRYVVNGLRKADRLQAAADEQTDPAVTDPEDEAVEAAVAALLDLHANSGKAALREAKQALREAVHEVRGSSTDETEETDEADETGTDDSGDVDDDSSDVPDTGDTDGGLDG